LNVDEVVAEALIGDEAKKFVESDLGRCVLGMAKQDLDEAKEKLIDATEEKEQEELRLKAMLARRFPDYLSELITRGEQALEVWKHESQE
jgi:hypothetical protein